MKVRAANLLPTVLILLALSACTPKAQKQLPPEQASSQFLQSNADSQSKPEPSATASAPSAPVKVDVDLTKMNANMIYSYIFEMVVEPETYTGKTIKVSGFFYSVVDEETGERYYAVIIPDALSCCKQGMEFKWLGEHNYPADYPQENQEITITGTYRTDTMAGDITYSYLEVSDLVF